MLFLASRLIETFEIYIFPSTFEANRSIMSNNQTDKLINKGDKQKLRLNIYRSHLIFPFKGI